MPNISRRTILASTAGAAVALPTLAAAALPTVAAAAVSPTPTAEFDATAFLAKLDEIGLDAASDLLEQISAPLQKRYGKAVISRFDVETAADILEASCDPKDLLGRPHYRTHYARRLRDALGGVKPPLRDGPGTDL